MSKSRQWLLIVSLSLNATGLCYLAYCLYKEVQKSMEFHSVTNGKVYLMERDKLFKVLPNDSSNIIFLGDSHIELSEPAELFNNIHIKNRGIGGDITKGVINRLNEVIQDKPVKLFIEIGTNDIMREYSAVTIIKNYQTIIQRVKSESPATKIYVLSIFPNAWFVKGGKIKTRPIVEDVNNRLKVLCKQEHAQYIDFSGDLEKNGYIVPQYYIKDSLHLSAQGYLLFKQKLEPYVNE